MAPRTSPPRGDARPALITTLAAAAMLLGSAHFTRLSLAARAWVGWVWLDAGRAKLAGASWIGVALSNAWAATIADTGTRQLARWVIEALLDRSWETRPALTLAIVGIAILTGLAALAGLGLAVAPGLTSAAAIDPLVALLAVGLALAWRFVGWFGLDRWVLPLVAGWRRGQYFYRPVRAPRPAVSGDRLIRAEERTRLDVVTRRVPHTTHTP